MTEDDAEKTRQLEAAAGHYRRAAALTSKVTLKVLALNLLANAYDRQHLNDPQRLGTTLRELIPLTPDDFEPVYRLARVQEDEGLIEAAELTLLDARHQQPGAVEPNRRLAQFYARLVTALHKEEVLREPQRAGGPGDRDENGVYRIGGPITPPARLDVPRFPSEAQAAGIQGVVTAEIVLDTSGNVTDAKILRSIPLLDDAALEAVRNWHYAPTLVNGQPVPVRMTVTVNFTLPPAPRSPAPRR